MRIETHTQDRKLLARAIAEWIHAPVHYDGMPTCAYSIGSVKVLRDGSIETDDAEAWAALTPFFQGNGWIPETTPEQEEQMQEHNEQIQEENQPAEITRQCVSIPLRNNTAAEVEKLIRALFARQKLINAMTKGDALFIDDELIDLLNDADLDSIDKICELLKKESEIGMVRGVEISDQRICMEFPFDAEQPTIWQHYADLLIAVADHAFKAHHVNSKLIDPEEHEMKYFCHSWICQLGFGGPDHAEKRAALLNHLTGYAAFRNSEKMDRHKARCAERRAERRAERNAQNDRNAEVEDNEADR